TEQGDEKMFGDGLTDQTASTAAQGASHGKFPGSGSSACKLNGRHVDAGNQQQEGSQTKGERDICLHRLPPATLRWSGSTRTLSPSMPIDISDEKRAVMD